MYITIEAFIKALIDRLNERSAEGSSDYYPDTDLIIIDNIEDIRGKPSTQIELLHTAEIFSLRGTKLHLLAVVNLAL